MNETELRILGPLEAVVGGRRVALGGRKQRALLALLVIRAGSVVSADVLIEEVWGARAPATVRAGLHVYLSRLRRLLGPNGHLVRHPHGYSLVLGPEQLDAARFDQLARNGRHALSEGDAVRAAETLAQALALWRGPALADLVDEPFAQPEARRLDDARLQAVEDRIEADLRLGRAAEVVPELEALIEANPFRERLRGELMIALYQVGRQADALRAYRDFREMLRDELGLDPSPELGEVHARILRHDRSLAAPPSGVAPTPGPPREDERTVEEPESLAAARSHRLTLDRKRRAVLAGLLFVAVAAVLGSLAIRGGEGPPARAAVQLPPNAVGALDPRTGDLRGTYTVGRRPSGLAVGAGAVWAGSPENDTVVRIDLERDAVERFGVGLAPGALAVGAGGLWVVDETQRELARVDASHPSVVNPIAVTVFGGLDPIRGVAVSGGTAWYAQSTTPVVHRIGPSRYASTLEVRLAAPDAFVDEAGNAAIGADAEAVWASYEITLGHAIGGGGTDETAAFVARIDARTGKLTHRVRLPGTPSAIAVGEDAVWVAVENDDRVWRLDHETGITERETEVAGGPFALAVGEGGVWVITARRNDLVRIDPREARVVSTVRLGARPVAVATGAGRVWVAVAGR